MSRDASGLKGESQNLLKKAILMALSTLTSRILGLFRDMAMAAFFDRAVTDAWTAAFRLPNFFRRVLGEGTFSLSFIPIFKEIEASKGEVAAQNLINTFYTLLLISLGTLTCLAVLFTEPLMAMLVSKTFQSGPSWELCLRMARIMFVFVFFVSSYSYLMALLHLLGSFALPALAPALFNISMLAFTVMPTTWFSEIGDGLAWGVAVGGLLQALFVVMVLYKKNYLPRWQKNFWNSETRRVVLAGLTVVLGLGYLQLSTLLNLYFGSALEEGALSYIYWADRLLEFPLTLVSVSLGTVMLPTLSSLKSQRQEFENVLQKNVLANVLVSLPASLGLYFLAQPIVAVLFQRGLFTADDTVLTAEVLKIYAISILVLSLGRLLVPVYSSLQKNRLLVLASLLGLLVHWMGALTLKSWGLQGLIVASVSGGFFYTLVLLFGLKGFHVSLFSKQSLKSLLQIIFAGILMSIFLSKDWLEVAKLEEWAALAVRVCVGAGIYILLTMNLFRKIKQS